MTEDLIRYDVLVQNALRAVIRKVLSEIEKTGLPGNHHFFITFMTGAPGVRVSSRVREQYPEQMTIVLQHQFWDLEINETGFGLGLSFSDVPEKLYIPFSAVRGFYDPSVNFELEFDVEDIAEAPDETTASLAIVGNPVAAPAKKPEKAETQTSAESADESKNSDADGDGTADVVSLDSFRNKK